MKMNAPMLAALAGLSASFLAGCVITTGTYVRDDRRPYYGPPGPVVVEERPVIVHRPPPPMIVERIGPRPGPEVVWVPGYYAARGDDWFWVPGHYERPPRPGAVWVEPRYERRSPTEVHFSLGFWR
jgi:hypothetical protein